MDKDSGITIALDENALPRRLIVWQGPKRLDLALTPEELKRLLYAINSAIEMDRILTGKGHG